MPHENRVPPEATPPSRRGVSPPFCRVEREGPEGRKRTYVVYTGSPGFLVEFDRPPESEARAEGQTEPAALRCRPVIRRVCVPNSWSGDYQHCARQLDAAADFLAATEARDGA